MTADPRKPPLRVLLSFARAQSSGDLYAFRFEPQDYILPTAGGASPSARFEWTPAVLADLHAIRQPGRDPAVVQRMGERLRAFVLQAGWADWERQIGEAIHAGRAVFLSIRSSAAELYALPWELLTLKSGQFVGEVDGLLVRFEWPETETAQEEPNPRAEGGRILVAWSGAVPASEHIEAIRIACAAGFHPFDTDADVLPHASLAGIVQKLKAAQESNLPIAVLHLLCHGVVAGSTFGLALDGDRDPVVVDATQIRQQLAPFAKMVRLVVLSACDSGNDGELASQLGSVAQTLHRNQFQSVIASRFPLSVPGSVALTKRFYETLLSGPDSLESAFLAARQQLALRESGLTETQRNLDWASLQLYARHEAGDDTRPIVFRPFRGLLAFHREHSRFFFGRDDELAEILSDLQALVANKRPRLLVVTGASGTGKSSLVLAAAVPALLRQDPRLAFRAIRPGSAPLVALEDAIRGMKSMPGILVVDQLEELFTATADHSVREAFIRELWRLAADPQGELRILLTLRIDFLGRCGDLVLDPASGLRFDRVAVDPAHQVHIPQMNKAQLKAAICEPVRRVGLELQEGLDTRLIEDVGGEPGALPLMEDALDVLWQRRAGRVLTQAAYDQLGAQAADATGVTESEKSTTTERSEKQSGVVGALRIRADDLVRRIEHAHPADLVVVRRLLVSLVAVTDDIALDTRRRVALASLRATCSDSETAAASFDRVLPIFVAARLLVQDDDKQTPHVEVAHEALIRTWPRLRRWLEEDRVTLLAQRHLTQAAHEWAQKGRDPALLYRGTQLAPDTDWRKGWRPEPTEREFITASEAQWAQDERNRLKQLRSARRTATVLGLLCLAATWAGWLAYRNSVDAKHKAAESFDRLLVGMAQNRREDPTTVAALLREATNQDSAFWIQSASDALQNEIADVVLRGHESDVSAVAVSRDGQKVVTGSLDETARVWKTDGSSAPLLLRGHEGPVLSVAFSPDGKKVVTGGSDERALVWNTDGSGNPIALRGHEFFVCSVAFSPDGRKIATGSADKTARIWNADGSGEPVVLRGHISDVSSIAFDPDGKKLVTGSRDKTVRIWSVDGNDALVVLSGHDSAVTSVAYSSDGRKIVTGSKDMSARVWNADGVGAPVILKGHESDVTSVAISLDGRKIITGSLDKTARIWNADGSGVPIVLKGHDSSVTSVTISSDGHKVVSGSRDGTARIWNAHGSGHPVVLRTNDPIVYSAAFSPDGKKIVTGGAGQTARIWNADGTGPTVLLAGLEPGIYSVGFSPDGKKVITGGGKTVQIWNADGTGVPALLSGHESRVWSVAISGNGKKIVTGSEDKTARIWNTEGIGGSSVLRGHTSAVTSVAISADGKKVVTVGRDGTALIWNGDGAAPVMMERYKFGINSVGLSPDGMNIVTGCTDKIMRFWNATGTGAPIVLWGHEAEVASVAFSHDGKRIVTSGKTARIWNVDGTDAPVELRVPAGIFGSVAFSADGKRLVTTNRDDSVRIWTVAGDALRNALWSATTDCLPEQRRQDLLSESVAEARLRNLRCRQEVARRRGWPIPKD